MGYPALCPGVPKTKNNKLKKKEYKPYVVVPKIKTNKLTEVKMQLNALVLGGLRIEK